MFCIKIGADTREIILIMLEIGKYADICVSQVGGLAKKTHRTHERIGLGCQG
jgi:hypothetical protein